MKENKYQHIILPKDTKISDVDNKTKYATAVIMYLYYEDTLENYFAYLNNIPPEIDVYVYSSKSSVCEATRRDSMP